MNFTFEVVDNEKEITICFRNLSLELIGRMADSSSIEKICSSKFYMYGTYDRVNFLNQEFMILKSSKRNVILLAI